MKKIKLILLALPFIAFSCFVDDDPQPFEEALSNTPYTVGFERSQTIVSYTPNTGTIPVEIYVNLLGGENFSNTPQQDVTFEIDTNASTAMAGSDYSIEGSSFTIDANREFGIITLNLLSDNLTAEPPGTVVLNLLTATNGVVAEQFKTTTIFICPVSDLGGSYTSPEIIASTAPNAVITEIGTGQYQIDAMPYIAFGGAGGAPAFINFSDVCGELSFGEWAGATLAEGTGTIDGETGALIFGNLTIYNGNVADPNDVWFDLGPSTYTPAE